MDRKWTLFTFSRGDFKTLERYLNKQAEQGWELEKVGIFAKWKRTDRHDLTYCVDLAKPRQDREDRLDYAELCREGGWELTAFTGQMYIFKSMPGAQPIPVHTDPELERKQYNKYYIRNTVLSVLAFVLYFGGWLVLGSALGAEWGDVLGSLRHQRVTSWLIEGLIFGLRFWMLWAIWKVIDFMRVTVKGRTGPIGESPRWVMFLNCAITALAGVGAIAFLVYDVLETVLAEDFESYLFILCLIWGGVLLYRALSIEKELFHHERRRHIVGGTVLILCFALLVVGRVAFRPGNWSTSDYSMDREKGIAVYEQTFDLPLVHGEDLGIPFEPEEGENVYIFHEIIPAGERWELNYLYGREKTSYGYLNVGTETTQCFTENRAVLLADAMADAHGLGRYAPWPEEGLTQVEIPWADAAWYGFEITEDSGILSVLVLRVGDQVTRMIYPADLMSEENLKIIQAELSK